VIAATATALRDAHCRRVASQYGLPANAIKTRIVAVAPMPNASVDTGPDSRK
jgi:hypothetical protein